MQKKQRLIEGYGLTRSDKKPAYRGRKGNPADVPNVVFENEQQADFEARKKFDEYMDDIHELEDLMIKNDDQAKKAQNSDISLIENEL